MSTDDEIVAIGDAAAKLQARIRRVQTLRDGDGEPLLTHLAQMWSAARNLENYAKQAVPRRPDA